MEGELIINGKDLFKEYGVFLTEKNAGEYTNLSELLRPSKMKPYTAVSFREEDGEHLPETLPVPRREAREFNLFVALIAPTPEAYSVAFTSLMELLQNGWLILQSSLTGRTYRVYYMECTEYQQLLGMESGEVVSRFHLRFREPQPQI